MVVGEIVVVAVFGVFAAVLEVVGGCPVSGETPHPPVVDGVEELGFCWPPTVISSSPGRVIELLLRIPAMSQRTVPEQHPSSSGGSDRSAR